MLYIKRSKERDKRVRPFSFHPQVKMVETQQITKGKSVFLEWIKKIEEGNGKEYRWRHWIWSQVRREWYRKVGAKSLAGGRERSVASSAAPLHASPRPCTFHPSKSFHNLILMVDLCKLFVKLIIFLHFELKEWNLLLEEARRIYVYLYMYIWVREREMH